MSKYYFQPYNNCSRFTFYIFELEQFNTLEAADPLRLIKLLSLSNRNAAFCTVGYSLFTQLTVQGLLRHESIQDLLQLSLGINKLWRGELPDRVRDLKHQWV